MVNKYIAAGVPTRFVRSITDNFNNGKDDLIIPQWLFGERKTFTIRLPFSSSKFCENVYWQVACFTNEKCKFNVV